MKLIGDVESKHLLSSGSRISEKEGIECVICEIQASAG
jgi:hypothetical protein